MARRLRLAQPPAQLPLHCTIIAGSAAPTARTAWMRAGAQGLEGGARRASTRICMPRSAKRVLVRRPSVMLNGCAQKLPV